jgi:hypothetical protein
MRIQTDATIETGSKSTFKPLSLFEELFSISDFTTGVNIKAAGLIEKETEVSYTIYIV